MGIKRVLSALVLAGVATAVNATLVGDTVQIAQNYPTIGAEFYSTGSVVGNNVEFVWPSVLSIDVGASAIDISFSNIGFVDVPAGGINHNGPIIAGLNDSSGNSLLGFTDFATNSGFSSSNIIFGSDYIGFNLDGLWFSSGQYIHVDLNFAPQSAVSEPASIALFGIALLGLAASRRLRR